MPAWRYLRCHVSGGTVIKTLSNQRLLASSQKSGKKKPRGQKKVEKCVQRCRFKWSVTLPLKKFLNYFGNRGFNFRAGLQKNCMFNPIKGDVDVVTMQIRVPVSKLGKARCRLKEKMEESCAFETEKVIS